MKLSDVFTLYPVDIQNCGSTSFMFCPLGKLAMALKPLVDQTRLDADAPIILDKHGIGYDIRQAFWRVWDCNPKIKQEAFKEALEAADAAGDVLWPA